MKKTIFFVIVMIFTMSSTFAFANKADRKSNSDNSAVPVKTENKLSEVEISRLTNRAEEIRDMDKTNMTVKENRELKKEAREIDKNIAKSGGTIYIGGAALILIIILIILLV
jgi:peptidoglycan hydrolase CwlO-like protein